jgi:REP element-mobilizing transposase RayT
MARKMRLEFAGACYHVINRGNYRRDVFRGKGAADSFERCLEEASIRFQWRVHAYVIMSNHFHLALATPEPNLSEGVKWLQATWAVRFNRRRRETGHPFQGRYKALHVEPGHALAQVAHYIHLNPVRARILPVERVLEYRWSSLRRFAAPKRPAWLDADTVLREAGGLADTTNGWRRYVEYLGVFAAHTTIERERKFGQFSRGWFIGSPDFAAELTARFMICAGSERRFELFGGDRVALRQARSELWEEKLRTLAAVCGIALHELPPRKSDPLKVKLAAAMKTFTSVSNRWLANRLGMGQPASVSSLVSAFRRHGGQNTHQFKTMLSRFAV